MLGGSKAKHNETHQLQGSSNLETNPYWVSMVVNNFTLEIRSMVEIALVYMLLPQRSVQNGHHVPSQNAPK